MKFIESNTLFSVRNFIIIFCNSLFVFSSNKAIKKLINKRRVLNPGPEMSVSLNNTSETNEIKVLNVNNVILLFLFLEFSDFILDNNSFLLP